MTLDVDPDRAARAAEALTRGAVAVERTGSREWRVSSFSGEESYRVRLGPPSCECPDSRIRGSTCKHQLAALMAAGLDGGGR